MRPYSTPTSFRSRFKTSSLLVAGLMLAVCFFVTPSTHAQTEVTGAISGRVTSSQTNEPVVGATVQIINLDSEVQTATKTDADGNFVRTQLQPGKYKVVVKAPNFKEYESDKAQRVDIQITNRTFPLPISLEPTTVAAAAPSTTPTQPTQPAVTPSPAPGTPPPTTGGAAAPSELAEETDIRNQINTTDARRGGGYRENEVATLPLGGTTLTRTFDELALLLPGVAPPPQTQGSVAGPGVGPGVGSAGQFAVNGLRSRANNFTVDGSDNNDEDIGVRRQGFFALVPQPIESIQEFRVITLLAPAQYGRNFGAQVNAVSKSGGNEYHGTIYGFFNSSQLNTPNAFDGFRGNTTTALQGRTSAGDLRDVFIDGQRAFVTNSAGREDSFTLGQGGLVLGGPLVPSDPASPESASLFFFLSAEGHVLNATKEESFAVPTVGQRGIFNTGATGLFTTGGAPVFPTRVMGDAIFSLFPFPNNPQGVYGENTYTQALPYSGEGKIFSGKVNSNFNALGMAQAFVARYNFTQDWRDVPVTGGAIFSTLRPRVRTQNFSTFLSSEINNSTSNVLRVSYGRTRLIFDEVRDPSLLPSQQSPNTPFLLNRPRLLNDTLPGAFNFCPGGNTVCYSTAGTTEQGDFFDIGTGPLGQVVISGFSPVGVDVLNFPQRRVNNTYQLADTVSVRRGRHSFAFGADTRRTELNSDLPRNARPLAVFGGTPGQLPGAIFPLSPTDLAAAGSPTGFFTTLARNDSAIHLRYYQLNLFAQDEWRMRPNLSLSLGVRYEYNTVPHESDNRIESTFNAPELSLLPDLRTFIDGRSQIFEPDRNNIAPRIGIAYSRDSGGRQTVIRAGYGLYYDQNLGSVISQSRNVYPTFLTLNTAGGAFQGNPVRDFLLFNPAFSVTNNFCSTLNGICYVVPGSLNTLNAPFNSVVTFNRDFRVGGFGLTLPERRLHTPMAHQYSASVEHQISNSLVVSAAYVGTLGRDLLRLTTPNLGPNVILVPTSAVAGGNSGAEPVISGTVLAPGGGATRPLPTAGSVNIFRSNGTSRYDALQVQARGRFMRHMQYQVNYAFSSVKDDVSDVFDLAGASALPQNSVTFAGEYAPSNFDARHRIAYNYLIDFPRFNGGTAQALFGNLQIAGTGQFQTGQPFTINSIYDVNLDGNLTDRLNTTTGVFATGDRRQPFRLTADPLTLLAALGQDGRVPRNTFRGDKLILTNLAVIKRISLSEQFRLVLRTEVFNLFNRDNYGIPVRFLEAPGFGKVTDTVTPGRRIQFAVKLDF